MPVGSLTCLLVAGWTVCILIARFAAVHPSLIVVSSMGAASAALAVVAGFATLSRWRFDGRAPSWWVGVGLVLYSIPSVLGAGGATLPPGALAGNALVLVMLVGAYRSTEVDTGLSLTKAFLAVIAAVSAIITLSVGLGLVPQVKSLGPYAIAVLYAVVAFRWQRSGQNETWLPLPLVGFALVAASGTPVVDQVVFSTSVRAVVQIVATLASCIGALVALVDSAVKQRTAAFEEGKRRQLAEMHCGAAETQLADTLHELRSTFTALEGGVRVLHPTGRETSVNPVTDALEQELRRLRRIVDPEADDSEPGCYSLEEALAPLMTLADVAHLSVQWKFQKGLRVYGIRTDVASIVHELLSNARKYAPESTIEIRAYATVAGIELIVDDSGPGVPCADRERIFFRGVRSHDADVHGTGVGLYLARRLARHAGGDLCARDRPGGGARFVLTLPAASEPIAGPQDPTSLRLGASPPRASSVNNVEAASRTRA